MGALMDEYERALTDFIKVTENLDKETFIKIFDRTTTNADCRSFETIVNHVLGAGYAYSNYIRKVFNFPIFDENPDITDVAQISLILNEMFNYMLETTKDMMNMPENEFGIHHIPVRWNQQYDLEQLLEHAIVHILRHRRQLEYFWTLI